MADHDSNELMRQALAKIRELKAEVKRLREPSPPVAIVGVGLELAGGVTSPEALWQALSSGEDQFSDIPAGRWTRSVDGIYTTSAAYIEASSFDPLIFSMSPRESRSLDPQHKLILKTVWWALEDAGISLTEIAGSDTGIYVALSSDDFAQRVGSSLGALDAHSALGSGRSMAAGRLGYLLDTHGPVMTIDTACSSSLVALHMAVQDLRSGRTDRAIVAGANLILDPSSTLAFCRLGALSPTGVCRSFDDAGDGYVRGEGGVALVLERESDAVTAGRFCHAVVRGSAVAHDGQSNGLTAPNGRSQEVVIRRALSDSGLSIDDIDYIEAHATGTVLGDPVELQALSRVIAARTVEPRVLVGTIKSAFGHLETAAGLASVVRTIEILKRGEVPPQANFSSPNRRFRWEDSRLAAPTSVARKGRLRSAGVSAFGMSGTNAHVIVSSASPAEIEQSKNWTGDRWVARLSAPDRSSLEAQIRAAQDELAWGTGDNAMRLLGSPSSAATPYRVALEAAAGRRLHDQLARALDHVRPAHTPSAVIAGYGGQRGASVGFAALESRFPAYRRRISQAQDIFHDFAGRPLSATVEGGAFDHDCQVATLAHQLAVADVLAQTDWHPALNVGYSLGEYAAAVGAGVLSPEDALTLVTQRALLCEEAGPRSRLMLVDGPAKSLEGAVAASGLMQAIVLTTTRMVVSSNGRSLEQAAEELRAAGLLVVPLDVPAPFHTKEMADVAARFEPLVRRVTLRKPATPVAGGVPGRAMNEPDYWTEHLTRTLRFDDVLRAIGEVKDPLLVEVGGPANLGPLVRGVGGTRRENIVSTIRNTDHPVEDLRDAIARLYTSGAVRDVDSFLDTRGGRSFIYQFTAEPLIPIAPSQPDESPVDDVRPGNSSHDRASAEPTTIELGLTEAAVSDHQIAGNKIIPAAYHLRLYREAAVSLGHSASTLTDVQFRSPIIVHDEPVSVQLQVNTPGGKTHLSLVGADGEIHSQCTLEGEAWVEAPAVELVGEREELDQAQIYDHLYENGYQLGPSYRRIQKIWRVGSNGAYGMIEDGEGAFATMQVGTLDSALQVLAIAVRGSDTGDTGPSIPFFIERVDFAADLGSDDHTYDVHAAFSVQDVDSGSLTGDLTVHNSAGRRALHISGLHARRIGPQPPTAAEPCEIQVTWEPYTGAMESVIAGRVIVVSNDDDLLWVHSTDYRVRWLSTSTEQAAGIEEFATAIVDAVGSQDGPCTIVISPPDVESKDAKTYLWGILRSLAALYDYLDKVRWVIATHGAPPDGAFIGDPLGCALVSVFRSAALELPEIEWLWVHADSPIDLTLESIPASAHSVWLDGLIRRVPKLAVGQWSAKDARAARAVIGATGAIGGAVMAQVPDTVAVTRRPSSDLLEGRNSLTIPDDADQYSNLVRDLGQLGDGASVVIQASGIAADASLATISWDLFSSAWDAKVPLTEVLAVGGVPVVVATTVAAYLGSPGQSAYTAVNGYVEGLARREAEDVLQCVALGPVEGSAMVAAAQRQSAAWERVGLVPMPVDMAAQALLSGAMGAVVMGDPNLLERGARGFDSRVHPRNPSVDRVDLLAQPKPERRPLVAALLSDRLAAVLNVDASQLHENRRLLELGVDSLMSLEVRSWLQTTFAVSLSMEAMFNDATVGSVIDLVVSAAEGSDEAIDEVLL